jgi:hypothetical protein
MRTYEKHYDANEYTKEGYNGRIYEGVVGWVWTVYDKDSEILDEFKTRKELLKSYPDAVRIYREEY